MSRWQKQLDEHHVWGIIDQIKEHLGVEVPFDDEELFVEKRRLVGVIDQIEAVLKGLDAETVPLVTLNSLHDGLLHIEHETAIYTTTPSHMHLQAANNYVSQQLLSDLSVLRSLSGAVAQKDQLRGMKKLSDEFVESVSKKTKDLGESVGSVREDMDEQTEKVSQLGKSIDARSTQLDELMNSLQSEFTDKMSGFIQEGEDTRDKILELRGVVAGAATTSGYEKDAIAEGKSASIWRICSIVFIVSTAAWLLSFILYAIKSGGEIPWNIYLPVASLTGVLLYGAVYSGQQSARHRNSEQRYRQLALRVAAFEPFVSSLDDATKNELRKDIAASIFGSEIKDDVSNEDFPIPLSVLSEIMKILNRSGK